MRAWIIGVALASLVGTAGAAPRELRIATIALPGTQWTKTLYQVGDRIDRASNRVSISWVPVGPLIDESDVIRRIALGDLEGADVSSTGLAAIDPSIRVLELPMMFDSYDEADYVAERMWPYFEARFRKRGYLLVARNGLGWDYLLSTFPIASTADLQHAPIGERLGDDMSDTLFAQLGASVAPMALADVEPALASGTIDTCYGSPLLAAALQWTKRVGYRTALPIRYDVGAIVLSRRIIDALPAHDRATILSAFARADLPGAVRADDRAAERQWITKGLIIVSTPASLDAAVRVAAAQVWTAQVGTTYSQDELDMVLRLRGEYRQNHARAASSPSMTTPPTNGAGNGSAMP